METLAMIFYGFVFILSLGGLSLISYYLNKNIDYSKNNTIRLSPSDKKRDDDDIDHHSNVA